MDYWDQETAELKRDSLQKQSCVQKPAVINWLNTLHMQKCLRERERETKFKSLWALITQSSFDLREFYTTAQTPFTGKLNAVCPCQNWPKSTT